MDADLLNAVCEYVEELRGRGEISDSDFETDFGKSDSSMESDRYNAQAKLCLSVMVRFY